MFGSDIHPEERTQLRNFLEILRQMGNQNKMVSLTCFKSLSELVIEEANKKAFVAIREGREPEYLDEGEEYMPEIPFSCQAIVKGKPRSLLIKAKTSRGKSGELTVSYDIDTGSGFGINDQDIKEWTNVVSQELGIRVLKWIESQSTSIEDH
ncbi:MAG: hypothetical protein AAGG02_21795 [Cyanobacteria bacterium P01_H01_bin.15]